MGEQRRVPLLLGVVGTLHASLPSSECGSRAVPPLLTFAKEMKHQYTKPFLKLWVAQMATNNAFIQDHRINSGNIGAASQGELPALREILEVYADYIDQPVPQQAMDLSPNAPDRKQRAMRLVIPVAERQSSIQEFIDLLDSGEIEIV